VDTPLARTGNTGLSERFLGRLLADDTAIVRGDTLCLVELRGCEPLTPYMPSRDPHQGTHHEPLRSRPLHQSRLVCAWWFVWVRRAELLRGCCANSPEQRVGQQERKGPHSFVRTWVGRCGFGRWHTGRALEDLLRSVGLKGSGVTFNELIKPADGELG
jgi:hypothetical protein